MFNITIPTARMYRVKADGSRYSKATRVFKGATLDELLGVYDEWPSGRVEFADADGETIDLEALAAEAREAAKAKTENTSSDAENAPETDGEPEPKTRASRKPFDPEAMAKRISALMAKADSTDSAEEAQAFYAKAEQLMLQYAIDRASLEESRDVKKEEVVTVNVPFPHTRERFKALGIFGSAALNEAIGLTGIAVNTRTFSITLYGREADVRHVRTIIEAAWRQAENHLRAWRKTDQEYRAVYEAADWTRYYQILDNYVLGFCQGAATKVEKSREDFVEATTGAELVLRSVQDEVQDLLSEMPKYRAKYPTLSGSAYHDGFQAGTRANLVSELDH